MNAAQFNEWTVGYLPHTLGIIATSVERNEVRCEMPVRKSLAAPHGYLHAGSIVSLADTAAGFGCIASLPEGAKGFTTIELKSNHLGTALDGTLQCTAKLVHGGRTTQVWDAEVTHAESGKTLALFRCTQLIVYERSGQRESEDKTRLARGE